METHHRVFWWAAVWDRPWPHLGPALALVLLEIDDVVSGSRSGDRNSDFRGALADAVLTKPTSIRCRRGFAERGALRPAIDPLQDVGPPVC
jgi:hypothetical protein